MSNPEGLLSETSPPRRLGLVEAISRLQAELTALGVGGATAIELPTAEDGQALKAALAKATEHLMPVYSMGPRTLLANEIKLMGVTFRWPGSPLPNDLADALDRFIAEEQPGRSRAEATEIALRDWAIGHGYLPNPPAKEDTN